MTQHGAIAETEISYSSAEGKIPCRIDLNQRREVTKIIEPTPDTNTIRAKRSVNFKIIGMFRELGWVRGQRRWENAVTAAS